VCDPKAQSSEIDQILRSLYCFDVSDMSVEYGSVGFWCAGYTEQTGNTVRVVLDKRYRGSSLLSHFYPKEEVVAHESVHFFRSHLPPSSFEELFAYKTSSSRIRRMLGPLFSLKEWSFLIFLSWGWCFPGVGICSFVSILVFLSYGVSRLAGREIILRQCVSRVRNLLRKGKEWAFLVRLTDEEIRSLRKEKDPETWVSIQKGERWDEIRSLTFKNEAKPLGK